MATILPFRRMAGHKAQAVPASGGAEIVIFPGVRYERWETGKEPAPRLPRRRRRVKS